MRRIARVREFREAVMAKRRRTGDRVRPGDRKVLWLDQVARDRQITPFALKVAVAIAVYTDNALGAACISRAALARYCRATPQGIVKAVKALVAAKHLEPPLTGTRARPTVYRMTVRGVDSPLVRLVAGAGRTTPVVQMALHRATPVAPTAPISETGVGPSGKRRVSATRLAAMREAELRDSKRRR
jgi:hypothetical protein